MPAKHELSIDVGVGSTSSSWVILSKLTQHGLYDLAMYVAHTLDVDMSELFERLAIQCIRLSSAQDSTV